VSGSPKKYFRKTTIFFVSVVFHMCVQLYSPMRQNSATYRSL